MSDHKPLQHLFQETSGIPILTSAHIQRWALILSAYDYAIQYKSGTTHANADIFSRLPLPDATQTIRLPGKTTVTLNMLESLPVTVNQIGKWTCHNPTLSKVRLLLSSGWEKTDQTDLAPYQQRQTKLSIHDACQRSRNLPAVAPIQPWEWPERPWSRLHVDYAGPLFGHMFLVLVDVYSKWMEVKMVKNVTSSTTITALRSIFAAHGIPELLFSVNGSVFTSAEFKNSTQHNGIRHATFAPYHPVTNGLAERAVQTFKSFLIKTPNGTLEDRLSKFLLN